MKSSGNLSGFLATAWFKTFVSTPYSSARSLSSITLCPRRKIILFIKFLIGTTSFTSTPVNHSPVLKSKCKVNCLENIIIYLSVNQLILNREGNNKTESHSTPLTHSEASAPETKEKQKLLELVPSELKSSEGEYQYVRNLMHSLVML